MPLFLCCMSNENLEDNWVDCTTETIISLNESSEQNLKNIITDTNWDDEESSEIPLNKLIENANYLNISLLHYLVCSHETQKKPQCLACFQQCLKRGLSTTERNNLQETPLMIATKTNNIEFTQAIISYETNHYPCSDKNSLYIKDRHKKDPPSYALSQFKAQPKKWKAICSIIFSHPGIQKDLLAKNAQEIYDNLLNSSTIHTILTPHYITSFATSP